MLGVGPDSIQQGDLLVLPNLPDNQRFCLTRVMGQYSFQRLRLQDEQRRHGLTEDYGHILPVELLTQEGVNKYAPAVHAEIRRTLLTRSRLWSLDRYAQYINELLAALQRRENLLEPQTGAARLSSAWESASAKAKETLARELLNELSRGFQNAEWEEPIAAVMRKLYPAPGAQVRWTGGAGEHGADLVIEIASRFSDSAWQIMLQIKNYTGEIADIGALRQLEQAYEYYGTRGPVLEAVVMTTAKRESNEFEAERRDVAKRLGIPIVVVLRDRFGELMAEGLS
jgi:hypothetical protein